MTKPRPIDPAWEELREPEYGSVWDRCYETFASTPALDLRGPTSNVPPATRRWT